MIFINTKRSAIQRAFSTLFIVHIPVKVIVFQIVSTKTYVGTDFRRGSCFPVAIEIGSYICTGDARQEATGAKGVNFSPLTQR